MATASTIAPKTESNRKLDGLPRRPRSKRRWVIAVGILLALYFSPALIARSSLRDLPLRMIFEGIEGTIHSGGASLGWFSPVSYRDVEILDRDGQTLAHVPEVKLERTVLQLLMNRANVGKVVLSAPIMNLVADRNTTNVEDVLLPWWNLPSSGPVEIELQVVDGSLKLRDGKTNETWDVSALQASATVTDVGALAEWSVEGKIGAAGLFAAHQAESSGGVIEVAAEGVPLAAGRWLLERIQPGLALDGELACELAWHPAAAAAPGEPDQSRKASSRFKGQLGVTKLVVGGAQLQGDELRLDDLTLDSDVAVDNEVIRITRLVGDCELARLTLRGELPAPSNDSDSRWASLALSTLELQGQVQLARLAQMLPRTLRLRQDIQLIQGDIQCAVKSGPGDSGHTWQARLEASGLAAMHAGQRIEWEKPLLVNLAAREAPGGFQLEALECATDFAHLTAHGTADELTAEATFDLDRLKAELGKFVDLEATQLAGDGKVRVNWQRNAEGDFQASAIGQLTNFRLGAGEKLAWQEDDLSAALEARGDLTGNSVSKVEQAKLRLVAAHRAAGAGPDELQIDLREPIFPRTKAIAIERLPVILHCQGNLHQWRQRLSPWTDLAGWDVAGGVDLHANLTWSPDAFDLHSLKAAVQQLRASNGQRLIEEPSVNIEAAGRYDVAPSRIELRTATLESSAASVRAQPASIELASGSQKIGGQLSFIGDLERLQRWTNDPRQPATIDWSGRLNGQASVRQSAEGISCDIECAIDDFAAAASNSQTAPAANPLRGAGGATSGRTPFWREKQLSMSIHGAYSRADDAVVLRAAEVAAEALKLRAAGRIDKLNGAADLLLSGEVHYDWQQLSPLLSPYVGSDVRVTGQDKRQFAVRGPIAALLRSTPQTVAGSSPGEARDHFSWLRPISAQAGIGWQTAEVFGMRMGPGEIAADMRDSLIRFKPIDLTVSEGRIALEPLVRLSPVPVIEHGPGKLIDRVRVSPEMTSSWLKYIAPAIADATQTEGTLSLELEGAQAPLAEPEKVTLAGKLDVHSLQVSPGAPARSLVLLAEQIRALAERRPPPMELSRNPTLLAMADQKVAFRMAQGRVYHQGMTMDIGPVTLRTQGWVALDESIGLLIEIPVKPEWFGRGQAPAGLKDQTLQIPMTGTLRHPQIDRRAWQQVAVLFGQTAAREVIEEQLNRLLQPR